jgi:hypothetical protein
VSWSRGGELVAFIGYTVRPAEDGLILQLSYRCSGAGQNAEEVEVPVRLATTPLHFGDRRWWGICPLVVNRQACNRRVGRLYLPPGGRYFGCRHCHRLTYRSAQEHDKRIVELRKNPALLRAMLADPTALARSGRALLAIKALG